MSTLRGARSSNGFLVPAIDDVPVRLDSASVGLYGARFGNWHTIDRESIHHGGEAECGPRCQGKRHDRDQGRHGRSSVHTRSAPKYLLLLRPRIVGSSGQSVVVRLAKIRLVLVECVAFDEEVVSHGLALLLTVPEAVCGIRHTAR